MKLLLASLLAAATFVTAGGCRGDDAPLSSPKNKLDVDASIARAATDADDRVRMLYERRSNRPAWVGTSAGGVREAIEVLFASASHGLNPGDYVDHSLQQKMASAYGSTSASDSSRARHLAELDIALTARLIELTGDAVAGRVDPRDVGDSWNTPVHQVDAEAVVARAADESDPSLVLKPVAKAHEQYRFLRAALERYRAVERSGGFPQIEPGRALSPGDSSVRVPSVRRRLVDSGDLDSTALTDSTLRYDDALAEGVRAFQERHGLAIDGVVGAHVVTAMNVPVGERIRTIALNLERWRWIPTNLGDRYLYVNIPAFQLRAFDGGKEVLKSNVVVGKEYDARSTPVFSDTMEYVVFNPYWNVPRGIAEDEILPAAREDASYLAANDYEIVSGWGQGADVAPTSPRSLSLVESGEYRIRQQPGPQNALGRIKFMFPNPFDIYLHDTPADYLFDRRDRAYSHGCIRVEQEIDLAEYAFTGWSQDRIEKTLASRERRTEHLQDPLPVYILYWTSFVDEQGRVHFREDIYGQDRTLGAALAEQAPDGSTVPRESLLSILN